MKLKAAGEANINCELIQLPEEISEAELLYKVNEFNNDPSVHGIRITEGMLNYRAKAPDKFAGQFVAIPASVHFAIRGRKTAFPLHAKSVSDAVNATDSGSGQRFRWEQPDPMISQSREQR